MDQRRRTSWWSVAWLGVGFGIIAIPIIGVLVAGPSNPYAALMLVLTGLIAVAIACAMTAYRLVRRAAPRSAAAAVGLVAGVPPVLPMLGSSSVDLTGVMLYGVVLGLVNWAMDRGSRAAVTFAACWALGSLAVAAIVLGGR